MRWLLSILCCVPLLAGATDIIPADWRQDWTNGTRYSGPRSTNDWPVYTNLPASTSVTALNSAIQNCPAGQMIRLSNGTFTVDAQITLKSRIRIEGGGPSNTILQVTASSGRVFSGGSGDFPFTTVKNWTGGYTKGATTLTVDNATSIAVGNILVLAQTNPQTGLVNGSGDEGANDEASGAIGSGGDYTKTEQQQVRVTGVSGTSISFYPALGITNWQSGYTPQVYVETPAVVSNVVLCNFKVDNSASAFGQFHFRFGNFVDGWMNNIWSVRAANRHFTTLHAMQFEITDCFFQDSKDRATHSYGIAPYNFTGGWFVNNIFEGVTGAYKPTSAGLCVFAYNYGTNVPFTPTPGWLQATLGNHGSHVWGQLIEGNIFPSANMDNVGGSGSHNVLFRNRFFGMESNQTLNCRAIMVQATNRCLVIAGNVLGVTNFHTLFRAKTHDAGISDSVKVVECYGYVDVDYRSGGGADGDLETFSSAIITHNQIAQHLNGGTNGGVYWSSGYDGSLVLENSYIFSSKPSWWGCVKPWPSIGPDCLSICTNDATVFNPAKYRFDNGIPFTQLVDNCSESRNGPGKALGRIKRRL